MTSSEQAMRQIPLDTLCVNTIRTLAMDAVEAAGSGHPGTPMALAPRRLCGVDPAVALPPAPAAVAGSPLGWREWVGDAGAVIGVECYGASAPGGENMQRYGFTVQHVVREAMHLLENR